MYVFVDYDGTLIKTQEEDFTKMYFITLAKKANMDPMNLGKTIMNITKELIKNQNGKENIYKQFMKKLVDQTNKNKKEWEALFLNYYNKEFKELKRHVIPNKKLIKILKNAKHKVIFASNPLFPKIAVINRLDFIEMNESEFIYVSHMENSRWLKPNPKYFSEILQKLSIDANDSIMIGDSEFDSSCQKAGIRFVHVNDVDEWEKLLK